MPHFKVFLGAPKAADLEADPAGFRWVEAAHPADKSPEEQTTEWFFPPATLEAASRRISLLYKNVIFKDEDDDDESQIPDGLDSLAASLGNISDDSTRITWPPTPAESQGARNTSASQNRLSFLKGQGRLDDTTSRSKILPSTLNASTTNASLIRPNLSTTTGNSTSLGGDEETQLDESITAYSDTSSITRFPHFHFQLHTLISLSTLTSLIRGGKNGTLVGNFVVAILEVDGPDTVTIRKGADAGKSVSLLKLVVGDESGAVCKVMAWRETAEKWYGDDGRGVMKGDIVLLQHILASYSPKAPLGLTASPKLKSSLLTCYRTMPQIKSDFQFRPDLRLGASDASVKKVTATVRWFQRQVGIS